MVRYLVHKKISKTIQPTSGIDTEVVTIDNITLQIFDISGHNEFRYTIWNSYVKISKGIIYLIDSNDFMCNIMCQKEWINKIMGWNNSVPILIIVNNKDGQSNSELIKILDEFVNTKEGIDKKNVHVATLSLENKGEIDQAIKWFTRAIKLNIVKYNVKLGGLYVFPESQGGIPLLTLTLDKSLDKIDSDIFGSFLFVLDSFSSYMDLDKELNTMVTSEHNVMLIKNNGLLLILIVSRDSDPIGAQIIGEEILMFLHVEYGEPIKENRIEVLPDIKRNLKWFLEKMFPEIIPEMIAQ